jgi:SPW repeat
MNASKRWQDWCNLVLGVWLIAAPFVLGTSADPMSTWNAVAVGVVIGIGAMYALVLPQSVTVEYIIAIVSAWLLVAPFAMGFSGLTTAAWNAWIVGACTLIASLWAVPTARAQARVGA